MKQRYHFNFYGTENIIDASGLVLTDQKQAYCEAFCRAASLFSSQSTAIDAGEQWVIEVKDSLGFVLFTIRFHVSSASAFADEVIAGSQRHEPG